MFGVERRKQYLPTERGTVWRRFRSANSLTVTDVSLFDRGIVPIIGVTYGLSRNDTIDHRSDVLFVHIPGQQQLQTNQPYVLDDIK